MGHTLERAARDLACAIDGVDWDAGAAQTAVNSLSRGVRTADPAEIAAAAAVLEERIARSRLEDADGVAIAVISVGTLVEYGADPAPLAGLMRAKFPAVLRAARSFADRCLAHLPADEDSLEPLYEHALVEVDDLPVTRDNLRRHLTDDRPGGVALAYLERWSLAAVAAWTRHRPTLERATADPELVASARAMQRSPAGWTHTLLQVQLDAPWRVLCPVEERAFALRLDGVCTNFDLHTLVADKLVEAGLPGERAAEGIVAYLAGGPQPASSHATGGFNFYDHRALGHDLRKPTEVPREFWVWNEGVPTDVAVWRGMRTLFVGPQVYSRTWGVGRTFSALSATAILEQEIPWPGTDR